MALAWSSLCLVSNSGKNTLYKHSINLDVCEPKTSSLKPIEVTRAVIFRCCFVEKVNKQFEGHLPEWATESHIFRMIKEMGIVDDRVSTGHCKKHFLEKIKICPKNEKSKKLLFCCLNLYKTCKVCGRQLLFLFMWESRFSKFPPETIDNINRCGGRHSSVDPFVPTILRPRARIPSTTSTLLFTQFNFVMWKGQK